MSGETPSHRDGGEELSRMLRALGDTAAVPRRDVEAAAAREERMVVKLDAELTRLLRRRLRARLAAAGALAAAAIGLLAWGLPGRTPASVFSITQERLPPSPRAESPPGPLLPSTAARTQPANRAAESRSVPSRRAPVGPSATSAIESQSTLGKENELFKAAAEASRDGDVDGALVLLERLLLEYPRSPLTQTALVRKFRLLEGAGRFDDARREAHRYLAHYPAGFGATEAEALLTRRPSAPHPVSTSPEEQP
jgi:hypothetical protein